MLDYGIELWGYTLTYDTDDGSPVNVVQGTELAEHQPEAFGLGLRAAISDMMNMTGGNLSVMDDFVDIRDAIRGENPNYEKIVEDWNEKFGDTIKIEISGPFHQVVSDLNVKDFDL